MNHEEAVVIAFIVRRKRARYLEFLSNPRKRTKITHQLAHCKDLDPRFILGIQPNQQNPTGVAKLLLAKGAGSRCWLISEDSELDGREMELMTALKATIGRQMGTFVSCVPGKLAYFEDEDGRYILER